MSAALARHGISEDQLPPIVALLMMTGLSQVLALEDGLGVTTGHDTTLEFIERAITQLERPAESRGPSVPPDVSRARVREASGKGRSV